MRTVQSEEKIQAIHEYTARVSQTNKEFAHYWYTNTLWHWDFWLSPWIKALIFAALTAFIGETLFQWLGFYVPLHWKQLYSFPIYFALYMICHRVSLTSTFDPLNDRTTARTS